MADFNKDFEGLRAIVTGGASGIGAATASMLFSRGARVSVLDRQEPLNPVNGIHYLSCDIQDRSSVEKSVHTSASTMGGLDIVINNAGMALPGGIGETTLEDWNRHMAVNLTSVFLGCQMAVQQMRVQGGGGSIINISSTAGLSAFANLAAYCASKGGVRLLTKAAALDVAAEGIRINSVHPGHLDTDMIAGAREAAPAMIAAMEANVPMKFLGMPSDVAAMNLFLASDESRYVTGAEFVVDGGLTAK